MRIVSMDEAIEREIIDLEVADKRAYTPDRVGEIIEDEFKRQAQELTNKKAQHEQIH